MSGQDTHLKFGLKAMVQLAWPSSLSMLIMSSIQLWAISVVGPLGDEAIAALTTGNRMLWLSHSVMFAIGAGTMAMMARSWGAKAKREAARVAQLSVFLTIVSGIGFWFVFLFFSDAMARVFLTDPKAIELTSLYLKALGPWVWVITLNFTMSTIFRAINKVMLPLLGSIVLAAISFPLTYAMTLGELGFSAWSLEGTAIASGIAALIMNLLMGYFWLAKSSALPRVPLIKLFHRRTVKMLKIGFPAMVQEISLQGGLAWFLIIVGWYGTQAYSAYGVGVTILSFSFLLGVGFSMAAQAIVGQTLGAKRPDLAVAEGWRAMGLAIAFMSSMGLGIIILRWELAGIFSSSPEMAIHVVEFLWCLGLCQPLMAIEFSLGGALRGAGDTRTPLWITMVGLLGVRGPLGLFFYYQGAPVFLVYAALVGDYVVKSILYLWRFHRKSWLSAEELLRYEQLKNQGQSNQA